MKKQLLAALGLALGLFAAPAHAQNLGAKGDAIFSAERLFGVRGEHWVLDLPAPAQRAEVTETVIAFGFAQNYVPYNIPRLAFDYMVIDKLSLGGSLGVALADASTNNAAAAALPSTTFLIHPRVGFLHMFGRVAGIWPRGGLYFHSVKVENVHKESGFGINAECMFPIVMAGHFGVEIGLAFDQSLGASRDPENGISYDVSYRSIALQVGLFGWI